MSVVWCNERMLKLIELYQNFECLWDTTHREYKNKLKKQDAWDSIAKTLDLPVKEVESKIHTLRSQFTRERKKFKCSKNTGSGSEDVYNIKWFAYEPLLFLIKGETATGSKDTNENHVKEYNSTQYQNEDNAQQPQNEDNSTQHQNEEGQTITQTGKKVTKKRSHDEKVDKAYEVMNKVKKRLEDSEKMSDDFDIYGKYVASELRNIKDEYSSLIAKQYINKILIDARIGKYRQEHSTYGYRIDRRNTPGTSKRNDSTRNQDSVHENNDDDVDLCNIISHL